jgi:hypothetical protein
MPTPRYTPLSALCSAGMLSVLGSPMLSAQSASSDEPIYELSPFVVETSGNVGYMATSTLAGTRLNTDLKEVGASVSVYTEEFLLDIDASSLDEILTYTTSTEVGGIQGNIGGFTGEGNDNVRDDPSGVNRVRALATATRTRDFFATDIPSDSFNFSELTISRGPNAILAGIGSAGGVIDASLRKANFTDRYSFNLRFGSHGTHREELHFNKVLIKDKLAFRLDALNKDEKYKQDPAYDKDRRVYMATTWRVSKGNPNRLLGATTVRANLELGSIHGVPPNMLPPVISVQSWFEGIDPRDNQPWASPKWYTNGALSRVYNADGSIVNNPDIIQGFPLYRQWALVFADPNSSTPLVGLTDPALAQVQGFLGTVPTGAQGPGGFLRGTGDQNRARAGFFRKRLQDTNTFDFYNKLLTGVLDYREQSFDAVDVRLEQLLLGGKAGFELAYNLQHFTRMRDFPISGGDAEIFIDTNRWLSMRTDVWNTTPNAPIASQLIENPNFGRPFIVSRDAFRDQSNGSRRESLQATAFYKHDFTASGTRLGRWLGRHTVSALLFQTDIDRMNRTYVSTWDPQGELNLNASTASMPGLFAAQVNAFYYIGPSQVDATTEADLRLDPITSGRPQYGDSYTLRVYDAVQRKFLTGTSTPLRVLGVARDEREEIRSAALSLQSHFLRNHLITLVGWRRDESDAFTSIDPLRLPDGNLDMSDFRLVPSVSQVVESMTKSVVLTYPHRILGRLPWGLDARAFWNESENFNPVGQRRNQWNEELGSPSASTREWGLGFSMLDGKFDLKVTRFETVITNDTVAGIGNAYSYLSTMIGRMLSARDLGLLPANEGYDFAGFQSFEDVARAFYETIPDRLKQNIGEAQNFNPRFITVNGVLTWEPDAIVNKASISDTESKGVEIELIYNPSANWRISLSVAKNEAMKSNVAQAELDFVNAWRANLESMYDGSLLRGARNPGTESTPFWGQYSSEHVAQIRIANALSGTFSPEIRKWRANLVTRYQFSDGFLAGLSVGATVRWQDKVAIGYPFIRDEANNQVADIANPYFGPDSLQVDFSTGYRRTFRAFGHSFDWSINLNLRNAIADQTLIPVSANADGSYGTIRIPPPRTWAITNNFAF